MEPTKLLYLEDMARLSCEAAVIDRIDQDAKTILILDQTVMYPQGGGQPYDQGKISTESAIFEVGEVRFIDGWVHHVGTDSVGKIEKGAIVTVVVEPTRRALNSRLHSAGHMVDFAVTALNLGWIPGKGFHFPDGPYVEYSGDLQESDKERLTAEIQTIANRVVQEDRPTRVAFMSRDDMAKVCHYVPENLPTNKPQRVLLFGDYGVPCGGTHVASSGQIEQITIRKIRLEKGNIRVSYAIE
jgi:Ser-tRNA(Ala) deacylase AlaX